MSGMLRNWNEAPGVTVGAVGAIQVETMLPVRMRPSNPAARSKAESTPHPRRRGVPRVTRLMALAIKFQDMIEGGELRDYADIARLGYVTRARLTQIMNLLNLAPDIQQALLEGSVSPGFTERDGRCVTRLVFWEKQREMFFAFDPRGQSVEIIGKLPL
jgi:hypothetical protein